MAILLLAGLLRVPQIDREILRDEQDTLRYHIHGYHFYDEKHGGGLTFQAVTWADAAFWNQHGNNPVLMSVAAKASLVIWQKWTGTPGDHLNVVAIRLPSLIAGWASIAVLAWCLMGFASGRVALLGALMAAIHPLHIDYCEQARGYAFVMLGAPLALGSAIRALRSGRWLSWIGLVGGCAIMLYAYIGSLFFVCPLALTVIVILACRWWKSLRAGDRQAILTARRDVTRLVVTGLIGTSIYLVLALPSIICFWDYREKFPWRFAPSAQWWLVFWTEYASGHFFQLPRNAEGNTEPLSVLIDTFLKQNPLLWAEILLAPALAIAGLIQIWRKSERWISPLIGVAFLTPFLQIAVHGLMTHIVLFYFYLIYWLPVVIGLEAFAVDSFFAWAADQLSSTKGDLDQSTRRGHAPWWPIWLTMASVWIGFLFLNGGLKQNFRAWLAPKRERELVNYDRGDFHWINYPEGRLLRLRKEKEIPQVFPEPLSGHDTPSH